MLLMVVIVVYLSSTFHKIYGSEIYTIYYFGRNLYNMLMKQFWLLFRFLICSISTQSRLDFCACGS